MSSGNADYIFKSSMLNKTRHAYVVYEPSDVTVKVVINGGSQAIDNIVSENPTVKIHVGYESKNVTYK